MGEREGAKGAYVLWYTMTAKHDAPFRRDAGHAVCHWRVVPKSLVETGQHVFQALDGEKGDVFLTFKCGPYLVRHLCQLVWVLQQGADGAGEQGRCRFGPCPN